VLRAVLELQSVQVGVIKVNRNIHCKEIMPSSSLLFNLYNAPQRSCLQKSLHHQWCKFCTIKW